MNRNVASGGSGESGVVCTRHVLFVNPVLYEQIEVFAPGSKRLVNRALKQYAADFFRVHVTHASKYKSAQLDHKYYRDKVVDFLVPALLRDTRVAAAYSERELRIILSSIITVGMYVRNSVLHIVASCVPSSVYISLTEEKVINFLSVSHNVNEYDKVH